MPYKFILLFHSCFYYYGHNDGMITVTGPSEYFITLSTCYQSLIIIHGHNEYVISMTNWSQWQHDLNDCDINDWDLNDFDNSDYVISLNVWSR